MQYTEFVHKVQSDTEIHSEEQATKVIGATLETLGERLPKTEQENLAAQLPNELKEHLLKRLDENTFKLEDFYTRISARADTGFPEAVQQSRVVLKTLENAVSEGEIQDVLQKMDQNYGELFGTESTGPLSPSSVAE